MQNHKIFSSFFVLKISSRINFASVKEHNVILSKAYFLVQHTYMKLETSQYSGEEKSPSDSTGPIFEVSKPMILRQKFKSSVNSALTI